MSLSAGSLNSANVLPWKHTYQRRKMDFLIWFLRNVQIVIVYKQNQKAYNVLFDKLYRISIWIWMKPLKTLLNQVWRGLERRYLKRKETEILLYHSMTNKCLNGKILAQMPKRTLGGFKNRPKRLCLAVAHFNDGNVATINALSQMGILPKQGRRDSKQSKHSKRDSIIDA